MNQSVTSCRDQPINAYYNNATWTPNQSQMNADLLLPLLIYAIVGAVVSVFNVICILTLITKKEFREKYLIFAVLAFGNLISTIYLCQAGFVRRNLIFANQYSQLINSLDCLQFAGPHLEIFGGQLPAIVLLIINIERLIAVYRPMFYKVHFNARIRVLMVYGCFMTVVVSQLFGYLAAYLNRSSCVNSFCAISNACGLNYFNYNQAVIIAFPVCAIILNIFTSFSLKRTRISITLLITLSDVLLIAGPNFVIILEHNNFISMSLANQCYLHIFFCCNSASNVVVYFILKDDFRTHLLSVFSCGAFSKYFSVTSDLVMKLGHSTGRVAPESVNPIRNPT